MQKNPLTKAWNFTKKKLQHRCFPVNFAKFLRTHFFYRTPPLAASVSLNAFNKYAPLKKNHARGVHT